MKRTTIAVLAVMALPVSVLAGMSPATAGSRPAVAASGALPIQHVVVIYQENHTFDNMLGSYCIAQGNRCDGGTGVGMAGTTPVRITPAPDIVPPVDHSIGGQIKAIDIGKMDGFYLLQGCTAPTYACYTSAGANEDPNLQALATTYALSDRTFAQTPVMSWEQHIQLGALTSDGFFGNNPVPDPALNGIVKPNGWGCASADHVKWGPTQQWVPPCIPTSAGFIPRGTSPVPYVPDFYDNVLAANNISYRLYGALYDTGTQDNVWSPGAAFATWRYSSQYATTAKRDKAIFTDISTGNLPQVSYVTPNGLTSQHNLDSIIQGDNWIGQVVSAIENSPYWGSTAIIISYDDCGCFYDHVVPPAGMGMRTPLVIVSPWVKSGYVDSTPVSYAPSSLAFIEWVFGLPPLTSTSPDNGAYAWQNAFNFTQTPLARVPMRTTAVPQSSVQYLAAHPASQIASADT